MPEGFLRWLAKGCCPSRAQAVSQPSALRLCSLGPSAVRLLPPLFARGAGALKGSNQQTTDRLRSVGFAHQGLWTAEPMLERFAARFAVATYSKQEERSDDMHLCGTLALSLGWLRVSLSISLSR